MENDNQGNPPDQANSGQDEIKNLKAEMSRKLSNFEEQTKLLKQTQEALLAQIQNMTPKATKEKAPEESLSDLMYKDPDAYARRVEEIAAQKAEARLNERFNAQARQQQVIGELVSQFPELNDGDHDLTKAAIEKFNRMTEDMKNSPVAYKAAVSEAALELGIKPKSKRERAEEDSYVGGSSSGARRESSRRQNKLDPRTEEFARLVGVDIDNPKVKERIVNNHGRKSYTKFE